MPSVASVSKFELNAKLAASLPLVWAALAAAIRNLTAIITGGPGALGLAAAAEDWLNRHFRLNTLDALGSEEHYRRMPRDSLVLNAL